MASAVELHDSVQFQDNLLFSFDGLSETQHVLRTLDYIHSQRIDPRPQLENAQPSH